MGCLYALDESIGNYPECMGGKDSITTKYHHYLTPNNCFFSIFSSCHDVKRKFKFNLNDYDIRTNAGSARNVNGGNCTSNPKWPQMQAGQIQALGNKVSHSGYPKYTTLWTQEIENPTVGCQCRYDKSKTMPLVDLKQLFFIDITFTLGYQYFLNSVIAPIANIHNPNRDIKINFFPIGDVAGYQIGIIVPNNINISGPQTGYLFQIGTPIITPLTITQKWVIASKHMVTNNNKYAISPGFKLYFNRDTLKDYGIEKVNYTLDAEYAVLDCNESIGQISEGLYIYNGFNNSQVKFNGGSSGLPITDYNNGFPEYPDNMPVPNN